MDCAAAEFDVRFLECNDCSCAGKPLKIETTHKLISEEDGCKVCAMSLWSHKN